MPNVYGKNNHNFMDLIGGFRDDSFSWCEICGNFLTIGILKSDLYWKRVVVLSDHLCYWRVSFKRNGDTFSAVAPFPAVVPHYNKESCRVDKQREGWAAPVEMSTLTLMDTRGLWLLFFALITSLIQGRWSYPLFLGDTQSSSPL